MAKSRPPTETTPLTAGKPANGKELGNLILLALSPQERTLLLPSLEFVRLNLHHVLHEAGDVIKSLYFLNEGLASVLTVQSDGTSVEVALIGKEGFVGLPVAFGFKRGEWYECRNCGFSNQHKLERTLQGCAIRDGQTPGV